MDAIDNRKAGHVICPLFHLNFSIAIRWQGCNEPRHEVVSQTEFRTKESPPNFTNEVQHRYEPAMRWARDMTGSILMIELRSGA